MARLAYLAALSLIFAVHQARCSTPELLNIIPRFVEYLGQQSASWNASDSSTAAVDRLCIDQLGLFVKALDAGELWAVTLFDSWGKAPSGALFGNVYEFGNFDQCRRVHYSHYYGNVDGQHCTLIVNVRSALNLPIAPIWYGICVPDVCQPRMVAELTNSFLHGYGMSVVNDLDMYCYKDEDRNFSALTITAIVLFSCYGALIVLATIVDLALIHLDLIVPSYVKRFSAYTNLMKITTTTPQSQSKTEVMDCVNGVRALSMFWIIVNHVHDVHASIPTTNHVMFVEYHESYFGVLFHRLGGKAVDIFLMLSGMLVAMKILRELDHNRRVNVLELWLHRIIRITPAYAAIILVRIAFSNYLGEGVLFKLVNAERIEACSTSWWSALLYIHNYVNPQAMCFAHTWYLSVDMQLYILSPLILIPLWKYGKRFTPCIILLALLSISCVFTTFMVNGYHLNTAAPVEDGHMKRKTYYATHARMSVWLFGVLFGYLLHKTKSRTIRLPKRVQVIGWTLLTVMLLLTGFLLKKVYVGDYTRLPVVVDTFYESLHRPLWAFGVIWVIFVCINGQCGIVNQFLSWRFWQPYAKLSYTMYLLHMPILLQLVTASMKTPSYFSVLNLFYAIFGLISLTTVAAAVWSVAFEYPFFGLEGKIFKKKE